MFKLVSTAPNLLWSHATKAIIPIGICLVSAAYLGMTVHNKSFSTDKSIPIASLRPGDTTHDNEYDEDQDAFLERCQAQYGEVFNVYLMNKCMTVVSGPFIREVFMNDSFNSMDALDEMTGIRAFILSMSKSNHEVDSPEIHGIVRDNITPDLPKYTASIVAQLEMCLDKEMAKYNKSEDGTVLVEKPILVVEEMVANAMANVFVGPQIAKNRHVLDSFITAAIDFGEMLGGGEVRKKSFWRTFLDNAGHKVMSPLQRHVKILFDAATPVVLERCRLEQEANTEGQDVCGHLVTLVLASVHTTSDTSTNILYHLAAYPDCIDRLFEEQQEVLDTIQEEREQQRQARTSKGEPIPEDLNPQEDRALSATAIKRMVHMDSFVREMFRCRTDRLSLNHRSRRNAMLSNGMVISKGSTIIINMKSAHQSPTQGEDVGKFRPWRFVGKSKAATKAGADFLPFGMGKHACPGRFLAIQQLKIIGALAVSRYSKIEMQDPSKTQKIIRGVVGTPCLSGLIFTCRQ
ncbi:hypothetical protein BGW38_005092 [Lunasporangiospora selenospora]|uniref:Cytochrome P450 n=1 Tax=Lunasporangiospora selenospora TaxID=979761 RepID=A0A9P6KBP8_9FUNG|nr:hypothetical protein BGW38_005092 [Lunasporangiospora selenospora]